MKGIGKNVYKLNVAIDEKVAVLNLKLSKIRIERRIANIENTRFVESLESYVPESKEILIVELNNSHGSVLANYATYFKKLGYSISFVLQYGTNIIENPLCRLMGKYRIWTGNIEHIKDALRKSDLTKFEIVFIQTTFYNGESVFRILNKVPVGRYGFLAVEHNYDPYVKKFSEEFYFKEGIMFTVAGFRNTRMLNLTSIGKEVECRGKRRTGVRFVAVGAIAKTNRNFEQLFSAVRYLYQKGYRSFEIQIIGPGVLNIPADVAPFIHFYGRLDYPSMYNRVESSDFVLGLLDYADKDHHKYIDNWATATSQLSYAFKKPLLIQEPFANSYHLTNSNSIIYQGNELGEAMEQAIFMSDKRYAEMQQNLKETAEILEEQSLTNLNNALELRKNEWR